MSPGNLLLLLLLLLVVLLLLLLLQARCLYSPCLFRDLGLPVFCACCCCCCALAGLQLLLLHCLLSPVAVAVAAYRRQLFPGQEETAVPLFEFVAFLDAAMMPLSPIPGGKGAPEGPLKGSPTSDILGDTPAAEAAAAEAAAAAAAAAADAGSAAEAAAAAAGLAEAAAAAAGLAEAAAARTAHAAAAATAAAAAAALPQWEATGGVGVSLRPLLFGLSWNLKAPKEGSRFFFRLRHKF